MPTCCNNRKQDYRYQHGVDLEAGPIVRPLLHIQDRGIVFGHVGLAHSPKLSLPGNGRIGREQRRCHGDRWQHDEITSLEAHELVPPQASHKAMVTMHFLGDVLEAAIQ